MVAIVAAAAIGGFAFFGELFGGGGDPKSTEDEKSAPDKSSNNASADPKLNEAGEPTPDTGKSLELGTSEAGDTNAQAEVELSAEQLAEIEADLGSARRFLRGYKRRDKAMELIDKILTTAPDHAPTLLLRAEILAEEKKIDEAIAAATRAKLADPDLPEAFLMLGALLELTEEWAGAIEAYERYLELAPRGSEANAVNKSIKRLRRELEK